MSNTAIKGQLTLTNVRLSFPDLFIAKSIDNGKPRYSASFLLDKVKDKAQLNAINKIIKELTDEEFGGKALPGDKLPIHDGDEKEYDGYAGHYYLSANKGQEQGRVTVVDQSKNPLTKEDPIPYAGCRVNAVVRFFAMNGKSAKKTNSYGKRICCSLEVVQFWKDDEAFGAPKVDLDSALPEAEVNVDDL